MSKKSSFGLHLSDSALWAVLLARKGKKTELKKFIKVSLPEKVFEHGEILDDKKLLEALNKVKKSLGLSSAFISPFNPALYHILRRIKIKPLGFETEAEAAARSILVKNNPDTYMLLGIGRLQTLISVIQAGRPCYVETLDISSILISETVSRGFGAEIFYDQINKHYILWHTEKGGNQIKKIIIYGEAPNLAELRDNIALNMRTEVELANVWVNIVESFDEEIPEIPFDESLSYAVALGLALKGFNS